MFLSGKIRVSAIIKGTNKSTMKEAKTTEMTMKVTMMTTINLL